MNKSIKFLSIVLLSFVMVSSCGEKEDPKEKAIAEATKLYQAAEKNKDANTARVALNQLLLLDPNNDVYTDSLARLYIRSGNFEGGIALAEKLIKDNKASKELKELVGVAYQQQENNDNAIGVFGDLYESTKDYRYLFQQAVILSERENKQEFDSMVNVILELVNESEEAKETLIDFPTTRGDVKQMVPLEASIIFLQGKVALESEDVKQMRTGVNKMVKSLEIFPDFEMAKYYLQQIEMMQRGMR
jgi:tetratricopeptide (TPR) repeat protein